MKGGKAKAGASAKADSKLSVKRKSEKSSSKPVKKGKAEKDPNKPKRPPSAFFVFMEEFRKKFKEENPKNKLVSVVGKAGGNKWKSMSEAEKAPYVAKAAKKKADYDKTMAAYNKKQFDDAPKKSSKKEEEEHEEEGEDSEVNDEEEEEEGSEEEEDDDDE